MGIKFVFCQMALLLVSVGVAGAEYCGTVNGQQYWSEIAGRSCTDLLKDMKLSNEHIDASRKGQAIEAITNVSDTLQKSANDQADAERQQRLQGYAGEDAKEQAKIQQLRTQVNDPVPLEKIKSLSCNTTKPGMGLIDPVPDYADAELQSMFAKDGLSGSSLPAMRAEAKREGKEQYFSVLRNYKERMQQLALKSFNEAVAAKGYVEIDYINQGDYSNYPCRAGAKNLIMCNYIYGRWSAKAAGTVLAAAQKCFK